MIDAPSHRAGNRQYRSINQGLGALLFEPFAGYARSQARNWVIGVNSYPC